MLEGFQPEIDNKFDFLVASQLFDNRTLKPITIYHSLMSINLILLDPDVPQKKKTSGGRNYPSNSSFSPLPIT